MKITYNRQADPQELPAGATAKVFLIALKIEDVKKQAADIVGLLSDTSWIRQLDATAKLSYEKTALRTIDKLVSDFSTIDSAVTGSFGQYLVSIAAGQCLGILLKHTVFPISELWKEKLTNNPGFDFHTESTGKRISFGEAKYQKGANPYSAAAAQIVEFIALGKDGGDAVHLERFATAEAMDNLRNSSRGFTIAFSLHSGKPDKILRNALSSQLVKDLCMCSDELQIVGVES